MDSHQEILFIEPAHLTRPYFGELYHACETAIFDHFKAKWRPIRRGVPRAGKEFDTPTVIRILNREFAIVGDRIGLLVVAPTACLALRDAVAEVSRKNDCPLVALSLPFPDPNGFERDHKIPVPPAVICDSAAATMNLAGKAAAEFRRRCRELRRPNVLLIAGEKRADSITRLLNFRTGLRESGLLPRYLNSMTCNWQRRDTKLAVDELLAELSEPLDIVFAANDEMALGARDAIRRASNSSKWQLRKLVQDCVIYGFDGIDEARSLIELDDDPNLRGSVSQDVTSMANALVSLIRSFEETQALPSCLVKVLGKLVLPPTASGDGLHSTHVWPRIPQINDCPDEWIFEENIRGESVDWRQLKHYRKPSRRRNEAENGKLIMDEDGRISRQEIVTKQWFYLKSTLHCSISTSAP